MACKHKQSEAILVEKQIKSIVHHMPSGFNCSWWPFSLPCCYFSVYDTEIFRIMVFCLAALQRESRAPIWLLWQLQYCVAMWESSAGTPKQQDGARWTNSIWFYEIIFIVGLGCLLERFSVTSPYEHLPAFCTSIGANTFHAVLFS